MAFYTKPFIFMLLIIILFLTFSKNYMHYMNMLMVFECFIILIFFSLNMYQDILTILLFCLFAVCESSLGLSIMVIMIRCSGSDYCSLKFLSC